MIGRFFVGLFSEKIGGKAYNACILVCACLHGSVVELPRICGMFWKCGGDIGFLFLAYQVGLNVVTLHPIPDRTN